MKGVVWSMQRKASLCVRNGMVEQLLFIQIELSMEFLFLSQGSDMDYFSWKNKSFDCKSSKIYGQLSNICISIFSSNRLCFYILDKYKHYI